MERAAFISAWDIDRQIGFGTMYYADHFGLAAGVFGQRFPSTQDNPLFPGFTGDEDLTFGARAYAAPINRETNGVPQVLHFGASVRDRQAGNDQPLFAYGNETGNTTRAAELRLTNAPVVTGRIGEEDTFWGLEAAALWGPLSLQGEYGQLDVELPGGAFVRNNPPGPVSSRPLPIHSSAFPIRPLMAGMLKRAGSLAATRHMRRAAGGAVPRFTTRCSTAAAAGAPWNRSGKYDVLDQSDTAFNNAGGCRITRLYPG